MSVKIWASNYTPKVGEIVKVYAQSSISEAIDIFAYSGGREVARWTIYYPSQDHIDIKPSMLGTELEFVGKGRVSGESDSFTMTIQSVVYPNELYLTANGETSPTISPGEIVKFTVTADNNASCNIKLYALVGNTKAGEWNISLVDGEGSIDLVPSEIGDNTSWYAVCEYNNVRSNTVTVSVGVILPNKLYLTANGETNLTISPGKIVNFEITADNNASCNVNLYALVNNIKRGEWVVSVVNGRGSISLVPSEIGDVTSWYGICRENNVRSNTVIVSVGYPYIDRANSGVIIDGELKPPGSYTVKKGTTITVQVERHSEYPGMVRTAILINGKVAKYWDEDRTGDILYKYPIVVDRDMEITMAVYYYDESEGVYKKCDEYGCGDKDGERAR